MFFGSITGLFERIKGEWRRGEGPEEAMARKSDKGQKHHIFILSDGTGTTGEMVVQAALTQFQDSYTELHRVGQVRNKEQVDRVLRRAQRVRGVVVYTSVMPEVRRAILTGGRRYAVPTIDVLGPVLGRLTDLLALSPSAQPGLFKGLDEAYFERIEAINFAIKHDDGLRPRDLPLADLVLVGVSRTSKTPISIYLSYRGIRVANVPIVLDSDLPKQVFEIDPKKIIGLTMRPERLQLVRRARADNYKMDLPSYTELETIIREIRFSERLFREQGWQHFDVTLRSIEEVAATIQELVGSHMG
jgi:regulator of PEP synthase PpsR (kinase-PPPase family)